MSRDELETEVLESRRRHTATSELHSQICSKIFDTALDAILVVEPGDETIVLANPSTEWLLGYAATELIGKPLSLLRPAEGAGEEAVRGFRALDGVLEGQKFNRRDGSPCEVDMILHLVEIAEATTTAKPENRTLVVLNLRDARQRRQARAERERLIEELQTALAEVKRLSGLLPICSVCKRIRDDAGYWSELEEYLSEQVDAQFSHGLCPPCLSKLAERSGLSKAHLSGS